jgi:ribonucleoside-triphosphate reductase
MKLFLFTTPTCPNCPAVKDILEVRQIEYELVDASTPKGLELARKFGVGRVPTLIETDDNGHLKTSSYGIDEIEAVISGCS